MKISNTWMGVISVVLGVIVLVKTDLPEWLVGSFLIAIGIVALIKK